MADDPITLAERYVLEERIASGGMATVWRARDDVLARTVAVKLLHPHLAEDESFIERFRIEALAAARLSHSNIVAIYDTGSDELPETKHFIVMEHCGGGTLADLLRNDGPLDPERVASVGSTICDALAYAHRHEVIHRDIKPANVLISDHGSLKVTDFGIAKAAFTKGDITTTGAIIGTVTYISPEQANGVEPDARSDLYALGIVLYELLIGRPPFREETDVATALKHIQEVPPPPRSVKAGIPKHLDAVITKALAKDPDQRFQSADEMREAIGGAPFSAGSTQVLHVPPARTQAPSGVAPASAPPSGGGSFISSEFRRILPVVALIIGAIAAAVVIGTAVTDDSNDDADPDTGNGGSGAQVIGIDGATDFDPAGDDRSEHPSEVPFAHDDDESTFWATSNYNDGISAIKDGVGLLFDLGQEIEVAEVSVLFDSEGYSFEVRAGSEYSEGDDHNSFDVVESIGSSAAEEAVGVDGHSARYWLIWIKDLPGGGGGQGSIREVRFFGS